ncbi:iron uptake transporter permease EfeU [Corynebacterium suicordis]|uniref:FTR1 family protein n=1 Tax=Corynebacterium suicordis DSM 45110 TaxID=1121369 RepID=A0ABR9ZIR9_9CORY|nr:iron uptake transporter permease EfeU [Corynebacterium suicordis]MBF4553337.1 FTR1 family protein [Corynebacterium suicordis DSM 45110]MDR6277690.1 high-affinity iron transporter [Corynebacterium suicordis]
MLYANFLIGLREGLEASMVVIILAAYLTKTGRKHERPYLWAGIGAALLFTALSFALLHFGTKTLTTQGQELLGGIASIITVIMITWMLLWMSSAGKSMSAELQGRLESAVGPKAVFFVAFLAVGREGIETILLAFDSLTSINSTPFIGLALGIGIAVAFGFLMYKGAVRVNIGKLFRILGFLLVLVAAGILRYGVKDLQEANVLPGVHNYAFDISSVLTPGTWYAAALEGMFNFVPNPTVLSFIAWLAYLVIVMPLFLRSGKPVPSQKAEPTHV